MQYVGNLYDIEPTGYTKMNCEHEVRHMILMTSSAANMQCMETVVTSYNDLISFDCINVFSASVDMQLNFQSVKYGDL